jgi:type I restriction-modification system DNA methylase subunit
VTGIPFHRWHRIVRLLGETIQLGVAMTERITEDLVRSHFKSDPIFDQVALEEQKSSKERIQKLFSAASKAGSGKPGFPEFIITFPAKKSVLIIVECKLDHKSHESANRDKPAAFAVDGVLHYMQAANGIDDTFDIIGIAVSGAKLDDLEVSHFHSPAGMSSFSETDDDKLLSIYSYLKIHQNAEFAKELGTIHIQEKAQEYNRILHQYEIPEHERCTFISAVLVALQDDFFRSSYKNSKNVTELVDELIAACKRVLEANGITEDRRKTILRQYEGIRGHKITTVKLIRNRQTGIEEENDAVLTFIEKIHDQIYPLVLFEEQGFDVLGRFYREFVRYAGSDQATGLVLTPEHITDLFCDLVKLTVDDVIYDPCCGTGGFLIAGLKRMTALAGNDASKLKHIKEHQLIGSEVRADMFTYACSNMMMRGDGKSQVYNEDCFSSAHKKRVRAFHPTVAMLNPPYSKANGPAQQLGFVLNALDDIEKNGRCVAIVQMSCALTTKREVVEQHKRLMKKHRLDAVISTPDQLFYPIGVNTCIMVFTAHVPHPSDHLTWFGYLKDDGFVIHKKKGRIPVDWDDKRTKFLSAYPAHDRPGLSVRHAVKADDEWLAEAYLETDFSVLHKADFEKKLRTFLGYQYTSGNIAAIIEEASKPGTLALNVAAWQPFRFDKVFDIKKGYYNKKPPHHTGEQPAVPFIGATEFNNGVTSMHDLDDILLYSRNGEENPYESSARKLFNPGCVTVSNNGSVGNAFFQPKKFTCSHDVNPLYLLDREMTPELGIFLSTVIEVDRYRWGYGRKWRPKRMPASIIKLPVDPNGDPDWQHMEDFIGSLSHSANLSCGCDRTVPAVKVEA